MKSSLGYIKNNQKNKKRRSNYILLKEFEMTRLKIKNCLLERYCNTVFWINNEKYILRPASEIEIIFSIYFSGSKKNNN